METMGRGCAHAIGVLGNVMGMVFDVRHGTAFCLGRDPEISGQRRIFDCTDCAQTRASRHGSSTYPSSKLHEDAGHGAGCSGGCCCVEKSQRISAGLAPPDVTRRNTTLAANSILTIRS